MRLIAGEAFGVKSNVQTLSPLFYVHAVLKSNASISLPDNYSERAVYIVSGNLNISGKVYSAGQMIVFAKNEIPIISATTETVMMMLGGEPLGDRHIWWNFVSSRKERIEQAKADWEAGRIKLPPMDDKEFIPLPDEARNHSPNPLS
jgi:redox-sensitive bicupin YhaK (pirin superfamily)